jgi:hypothetical protein
MRVRFSIMSAWSSGTGSRAVSRIVLIRSVLALHPAEGTMHCVIAVSMGLIDINLVMVNTVEISGDARSDDGEPDFVGGRTCG